MEPTVVEPAVETTTAEEVEKERKPSFLDVMFVGCGGNFYCSLPMIAQILRRLPIREVLFVDPDTLTETNLERQWGLASNEAIGAPKAELASLFLEPAIDPEWTAMSALVKRVAPGQAGRVPGVGSFGLYIVNGDNDDVRIDMWNHIQTWYHTAIMVVSGCDAERGQAYWGAWHAVERPEKIGLLRHQGMMYHDWTAEHPDVKEGGGGAPIGGCGGQDIFANALTAQLACRCIEDALAWAGQEYLVEPMQRRLPPIQPTEYYWEAERREGIERPFYKMFTRQPKPTGGPTARLVRMGFENTRFERLT